MKLVFRTMIICGWLCSVCLGQGSVVRISGEVFGNGPTNQRVQPNAPAQPAEPAVYHSASRNYLGVMGQVTNPGVYEFEGTIPRLQEIIRHCGGLTRYASSEMFVVSSTRPLTEIDLQRHQNFQFQSGDVLLVETPARYYRQIGQVGSEVTKLSDIHVKTQLALLNLIDRPVILSVSPGDARMASLLSLLNQNSQAMVNLQMVMPPNANEIPATAPVAPGLLSSGSVLVFDPRAINSGVLPQMPAAIRVSNVQMASYKKSESTTQDLSVNVNPAPGRSIGPKTWSMPPIPTNHFSNEPVPTSNDFVPLPQNLNKSASSEKPRATPSPVQETSDKAVAESNSAGGLPEMFISSKDQPESSSILSSEQRNYVVAFLILLGVFGAVFWVRNRDRGEGGIGRYQFSSNRYSSLPDTSLPEQSIPIKRIVPSSESLSDTEKTTKASKPVAKSLAKVAAPPKQTEKAPAAKPAPEAIPLVTTPTATRETTAPTRIEAKPTAPLPPVPASIMDRILLQELIEDRLPTEHEPITEERMIADELERPHHAPVRTVPAEPAQVPQNFRVDEPHAVVPQPLFPIIWNITAAPRETAAELPRYIPATHLPSANTKTRAEVQAVAPVVEPVPTRDVLPSETAVSKPSAPVKGGALLDRVLLTIQRERRK